MRLAKLTVNILALLTMSVWMPVYVIYDALKGNPGAIDIVSGGIFFWE